MISLAPVLTDFLGRALLSIPKQNASEAGNNCLAHRRHRRGRFGNSHNPLYVFIARSKSNAGHAGPFDLLASAAYDAARGSLCLPAYGTPAKVAGSTDSAYDAAAVAGVFRVQLNPDFSRSTRRTAANSATQRCIVVNRWLAADSDQSLPAGVSARRSRIGCVHPRPHRALPFPAEYRRGSLTARRPCLSVSF